MEFPRATREVEWPPRTCHFGLVAVFRIASLPPAIPALRYPSLSAAALLPNVTRCSSAIVATAVCGIDVRLESVSIALDAAHIRWHRAGGTETADNGLALCVLHHKTFDLGTFTVSGGVLVVSNQAKHDRPTRGAAGLSRPARPRSRMAPDSINRPSPTARIEPGAAEVARVPARLTPRDQRLTTGPTWFKPKPDSFGLPCEVPPTVLL